MIYHITTRKEWDQAQSNGTYKPAGFDTDGFIHCSTKEQVCRTANRFYKNRKDLVLLQINDTLDPQAVVYENTEGGTELFPHLYKMLPVSMVSRILRFQPNEDGTFSFPES